MTDPMEFATLPATLKLVAADIADVDLARDRNTLRRKFKAADIFLTEIIGSSRDPYPTVNKASRDSWSTRELAVIRVREGINNGTFAIFFRDPQSGLLIQVAPEDLCRAVYCEEIMRGGVVRAAAGESIEKYRGWEALTKTVSVKQWRAAEKSRRPAADEAKCRAWLLEAMLANPTRSIKAKLEWQTEARQLFGVTVRAFNRAWRSAIEESGSTWNRAGAPRKPLQ
jgi:hypothetical protein